MMRRYHTQMLNPIPDPFPFLQKSQLGIYVSEQDHTIGRKILPTRRKNITQRVKIDKQTVYYTFGLYEDGTPGELFIDVAKAGSALRTWASEAGMMLSVALQHGTPLESIITLFIGTASNPSGVVRGHPFIFKCLSIMDLIARDMAVTFLHLDQYRDEVYNVGDSSSKDNEAPQHNTNGDIDTDAN